MSSETWSGTWIWIYIESELNILNNISFEESIILKYFLTSNIYSWMSPYIIFIIFVKIIKSDFFYLYYYT